MIDHLQIGQLEDADVAPLLALWASCSLTGPWTRSVRDLSTARACPASLVFVARAEGGVVGTAIAGFDGHQGSIHYLVVDPCLQRNGIGAALVKHAESWLRGAGAEIVHLRLGPRNPAVAAFYRKLGYADQQVAGARLRRLPFCLRLM